MTNRNNWQTSITVQLPDFSAGRLADLKDNDICFIELTGSDCKFFENYNLTARNIFKTASDFDVKIRSVHLPFSPFPLIDPASGSTEVRNNFLEKQSEILRISADKGAEIAVVHPSAEPYQEEKRNENLKYSIDSLSKLNDIAIKAGIKLAVENLPRTCICRDCKEISKVAKEIPDIYFCFDSNHSLIDDNIDVIKAMGEKIVATHISDYVFIDEMHLFPGLGKNKWQKIIQCLEEVNYNGTWNYEIRDCTNIPAKEFKENHLKLLSGEIK